MKPAANRPAPGIIRQVRTTLLHPCLPPILGSAVKKSFSARLLYVSRFWRSKSSLKIISKSLSVLGVGVRLIGKVKSPSDAELLAKYAPRHSEVAFGML